MNSSFIDLNIKGHYVEEFIKHFNYIVTQLETLTSFYGLDKTLTIQEKTSSIHNAIRHLNSTLIDNGILATPISTEWVKKGVGGCGSFGIIRNMSPRLKKTGEYLFVLSHIYWLNINMVAEILSAENKEQIAIFLISPIEGERRFAQEILKHFFIGEV
jgi:hypothetical protein